MPVFLEPKWLVNAVDVDSSNTHNEKGMKEHCVKSVRIWSLSGPYFPAFGLNTERYEVSLSIQSECEKMRTRKTPNTDRFHPVENTKTESATDEVTVVKVNDTFITENRTARKKKQRTYTQVVTDNVEKTTDLNVSCLKTGEW